MSVHVLCITLKLPALWLIVLGFKPKLLSSVLFAAAAAAGVFSDKALERPWYNTCSAPSSRHRDYLVNIVEYLAVKNQIFPSGVCADKTEKRVIVGLLISLIKKKKQL